MTKETLEEITGTEFNDFLEMHDHEFGGEYYYFPQYWPVRCVIGMKRIEYYKVQPYYDEHMEICKR